MDILENFYNVKLPVSEPLGYTIKLGNNILLSAPHAVSQTRNGNIKSAEAKTFNLIQTVADLTGASLIAKTCNDGDDANFDYNSNYRNKIASMLETKQVKYIIDVHCLKSERSQQINIGTNNGFNVVGNFSLLERIQQLFKNNNLTTTIDYPFVASSRTIAGFFSKTYNVFTLQIEINSGLFDTDKQLLNLINAFTQIVNSISSYDKTNKNS